LSTTIDVWENGKKLKTRFFFVFFFVKFAFWGENFAVVRGTSSNIGRFLLITLHEVKKGNPR